MIIHLYEIIQEYFFDYIRNFSVEKQYNKSTFNPEIKIRL